MRAELKELNAALPPQYAYAHVVQDVHLVAERPAGEHLELDVVRVPQRDHSAVPELTADRLDLGVGHAQLLEPPLELSDVVEARDRERDVIQPGPALVEPVAGPVLVLRQGQRDRAGRMVEPSSPEAVALDVGVVQEPERLAVPLGALVEVGDGEAHVVVTGYAGHESLLLFS